MILYYICNGNLYINYLLLCKEHKLLLDFIQSVFVGSFGVVYFVNGKVFMHNAQK
jgi:hypothetical protein